MQTESETGIVPANQTGTQIAKASDQQKGLFVPVDLNVPIDQVPDLENAQVAPFDLMTEYWTPEKPDEFKNLFFDKIEDVDYPNPTTGEVTTKATAYFIEKKKTEAGSEMVSISNASSRLVSRLQSYYAQGMITFGTPLRITYKGKKRNSTNSFSSDDWSVKPMLVEIKTPAQ